ncbi:MAG: DUF131 domain-containing protein [Candidatus Thermoplasmatota archaeon]|jgi:uncharacterized protein (TIGR00304 family)|nr:DUF131 domain-containing protein [Candidatus Thermoplasmatota archaeon]
MNKYHFLSLTCFSIGIIFFIIGFIEGDVKSGFFIIFPFIMGSGIYAMAGFFFVFIALLLFIFGFSNHFESKEILVDQKPSKPIKKTSIKGGGIALIGPIPIVFGSNWKIAVFLMVLAIILIIIAFFTFKSI